MVASFPSDMPDFRAATSHLAPLDIPCQMTMYYSGTEGRMGITDSAESPFVRSERRRLRDWLLTNIPVQWNKHAKHFNHSDSGVSIQFEDGTTAQGDFLIGADGINSRVREHLISRPASDILKTVPMTSVWGEVELSGEAFHRQLALGHSAYNITSANPPFVCFNGLHYAHPDGDSGRFYWTFMEADETAGDADNWLEKATKQEKLQHVLEKVAHLEPKFREAYRSTQADDIKEGHNFFRDVQLESLPAERVVLVGDAAHAMAPFRGIGGYNAFVDALNLAKVLIELREEDSMETIRHGVAAYNEEMLSRGRKATQASRNTHKNFIDHAWFLAPLLKYTPSVLSWLMRMAVPQMPFQSLKEERFGTSSSGQAIQV